MKVKKINKGCTWKVLLPPAKTENKPLWYIPCINADSDWLSYNLVYGFNRCPYCGKVLYIKEK